MVKIVGRENLKYKTEHEESLIKKNYTLGFFNSYLGMAWAAFIDQKMANICGLMLSVTMLKQIIMNLRDLRGQNKRASKLKFPEKRARLLEYQENNPHDY